MSTATQTSTSYAVDRTHSEVLFRVRHLLSRVGGQFKDFAGTLEFDPQRPEAAQVEFTVETASIDTGVADRDTHLRSDDFFAVESHPRMTFTSERIVKTGDDSFDVHGTLTLRGTARPVTLKATYLGLAKDPWGNEKIAFEATTRLNRKEFGLTWNAALETGGFLVSDKIRLEFDVSAVKLTPTA